MDYGVCAVPHTTSIITRVGASIGENFVSHCRGSVQI